ncbi:hypothetical protein IH575_03760 [Candidatus Dojkabacteria bacterium]|nr:hypothetical protein [Candidatus Dojkabacteria bacterium]
MNEYIRETDSGEVIFQTYESDSYVKESLVGSFHSFFKIIFWINKIFQLAHQDKLNGLYERYKELGDRLNPI